MHVYRDAIRTAPDCPAFDSVYIVVPNYDVGMSRFFNDDYRNRYNFGGFRLTPGGEDDTVLEAVIQSLLDMTESCDPDIMLNTPEQ